VRVREDDVRQEDVVQSATKLKKKTSATTGFANGSATRTNVGSLVAPVYRRSVERAGPGSAVA
jgi:hypothetical protein